MQLYSILFLKYIQKHLDHNVISQANRQLKVGRTAKFLGIHQRNLKTTRSWYDQFMCHPGPSLRYVSCLISDVFFSINGLLTYGTVVFEICWNLTTSFIFLLHPPFYIKYHTLLSMYIKYLMFWCFAREMPQLLWNQKKVWCVLPLLTLLFSLTSFRI